MQEEYIRRGRGLKFKSLLPYESANVYPLALSKVRDLLQIACTWVSLMAQKRLRKLNYN